ncbi:hypothetical protein GJAV_G00137050 [Gymnothorax javanicus]|nr:hypothetical protein GJAV_G00137050 [Gymnothorax javanicus]
MVRPFSGSPRQKHRPFSHSYGSHELHGRMQHADEDGLHTRDQRHFRGAKAPQWRAPRGRGAPHGRPLHFTKGSRLMNEWREPPQHFQRPAGQWRPRGRGRFRGHAPLPGRHSLETHHGHRKPSPTRTSHSPPSFRQRTPGNGPPVHKRLSPRAPFHGPHPGHRSPSPHHFHSGMRHLSPAAHSGPHWRSGPPEEDRNRDRCTGERHFDRVPRGERWNGGFPRPRSGERRFSNSPQRNSEEFHRRGSYPERLSSEREARKHGESEHGMEDRRSTEWGEQNRPNHSYRSPKWKAGSSPSFPPRLHQHHHPQDRPTGRPLKRKHPEGRSPSTGPEFEDCAKRMRMETPQRFFRTKGFRGRGLSFKEKSRLLKGRNLRAMSETEDKPKTAIRTKPKHPKTPPLKEEDDQGEEKPCSSVRKARSTVKLQNEQPEVAKAHSLKKGDLKRVLHKTSCPPDSKADLPRETETLTIKVDTRHTLTTRSSSPSDRQLSRDLVTVSKRGLGSWPEERNGAPWRDRTKKSQTTERFFSSHGNLTLNERFSKLQNSSSSSHDHMGRYSGLKRQIDVPLLGQKAAKPSKIMGPPQPNFRSFAPYQKPPHHLRRPFHEPPAHLGRFGQFKRPLMGNQDPRIAANCRRRR